MRTLALAAVSAMVLIASCAGPQALEQPLEQPGAVRILLVGDVMVGRGVSAAMSTDPAGVFAGVAHLLDGAGAVGGNLESPLTTADPAPGVVNDLRADPGAAAHLAAAGFDVLSLANNHAADGGPDGIVDTIENLASTGITAVGAGETSQQAIAPTIVDGAITIAFLAFDATGIGPAAGVDSAGVSIWDRAAAQSAVGSAHATADVVVVSIHGGAEYIGFPDRTMEGIASDLAGWGVDVVWGHGAHVPQPVRVLDPDGDGRPTLVATSLGNFLFDQEPGATASGLMLEIVAAESGVRAYRIGDSSHDRRSIRFDGWRSPDGDAVAFAGSWWAPTVLAVDPRIPSTDIDPAWFDGGDVMAVTTGDITGDGEADVAVSFRRPYEEMAMHRIRPDIQWQDGAGRSAHVGIYTGTDHQPAWVAGALVRPIQRLAACDGAMAVAYSTLDNRDVIGGSAWTWNGFGFSQLSDLAGPGVPACIDIDLDGSEEAMLIR